MQGACAVSRHIFLIRMQGFPSAVEEGSNTAGSGDRSKLPYSDYELVLARWKEDVSW